VQDLALGALHGALRGLSARQRVMADNVANVETPEFLASKVDFEASLRSAVAGGDPLGFAISSRHSLAPTTPNGNNVSLDEEMIGLIDTELRYQLAVEGMNFKYQLLRTAMGR
jgi:flagellar basal-body rod protein FlgB